jgi:hypothetical protein
MRRLQVLCPQEYKGMDMRVTPCDKCSVGWNKAEKRCTVDTGAEHLPDELEMPICPIQESCQHELQGGPCVVRRKGLICESALIYSGMSEADAAAHPLGFHAGMT